MFENIEALNNSKRLSQKFLTEPLLAIEIKIIQILMNKPVYLDLQILEVNKKVLDEFWYDYVKTKYVEDCVIWIVTVLLYT